MYNVVVTSTDSGSLFKCYHHHLVNVNLGKFPTIHIYHISKGCCEDYINKSSLAHNKCSYNIISVVSIIEEENYNGL